MDEQRGGAPEAERRDDGLARRAVEAVALLSLIFRRRVGDPAGGRGRRAVKRKHSDFPTNAEEVVAEDAETSAVVTDDGSRAATRRTCCFVV